MIGMDLMRDSPLMRKSKFFALEVIKACKVLREAKCVGALVIQMFAELRIQNDGSERGFRLKPSAHVGPRHFRKALSKSLFRFRSLIIRHYGPRGIQDLAVSALTSGEAGVCQRFTGAFSEPLV